MLAEDMVQCPVDSPGMKAVMEVSVMAEMADPHQSMLEDKDDSQWLYLGLEVDRHQVPERLGKLASALQNLSAAIMNSLQHESHHALYRWKFVTCINCVTFKYCTN